MDQDAVALDDAARGKCRRQRRDAAVDLAPGPGSVAPDEAGAVAMPAGILGQQMREIHHPARHPRHAATRRGGSAAHRCPIHRPAPSKVGARFMEVPPSIQDRATRSRSGKVSWQWFIVIPHRSARPAGSRPHVGILNSNGVAVMRFPLKQDGVPAPSSRLVVADVHRTPVPLQRWHLTTLSPFFRRPLPSQFLHFCFFLMFGPFSLAMMIPPAKLCAGITMVQSRFGVYKHA